MKDSSNSIQSVLTATKVLNAIAVHGRAMRPIEIARQLDMTLPRVSRHLKTLQTTGLVVASDPQSGYSLGWKLMELGKAAENQNELTKLAHTALADLHKAVEQTVILSKSSGENAVVLDCIGASTGPSITLRKGQILRLPTSTSARLIYCFKPPEEQRLDLAALSPQVLEQFESTSGLLSERVKKVRNELLDYDANPHSTGFSVIAAPIFDSTDGIAAAVGIILPASKFTAPPSDDLVQNLYRCAAHISFALGSSDLWSDIVDRS
jgi:DNA-binding IclR family transcriptional regulator